MRNVRERIERGESAVSDQTLPTVNIITHCAPETAPVLLDVFKQCAKQDTYSDHARMCGCSIISYLLCISSWNISYFSNDCDQILDKPQLKKRRVYFGSQFAGGPFPPRENGNVILRTCRCLISSFVVLTVGQISRLLLAVEVADCYQDQNKHALGGAYLISKFKVEMTLPAAWCKVYCCDQHGVHLTLHRALSLGMTSYIMCHMLTGWL